jgi:uncharacterized RDD family membrane protein YckC
MHRCRSFATAIDMHPSGTEASRPPSVSRGLFVSNGYDPEVDENQTTDPPGDSLRRGSPILSSGEMATGSPAVAWTPPPAVPKGAIEVAQGIVLAGIGTRVAAFLVDAFILVSASITITIVSSNLAPDTRTAELTAELVAIALAIGYFTVSWIGPWAATPGQHLAGIRIADAETLQPINAQRALLRSLGLGLGINLLSFAAPIGPIISAVFLVWPVVLLITTVLDTRRQGLHDRWTRTLAVRASDASTGPLTAGCLLIVLLVFAAPFIFVTAAGPAIRQQLEALRSTQP